jgi:hypothetical protein
MEFFGFVYVVGGEKRREEGNGGTGQDLNVILFLNTFNFYSLVFVVLGSEARTSHLLGKCSTA